MEETIDKLYQEYVEKILPSIIVERPSSLDKLPWGIEDAHEKRYLTDKDGNRINDIGFDEIYKYTEGRSAVLLNGKYNFVDEKGHLILKKWCNDFENFSCGVAKIKYKNHWIYVNKAGLPINNKTYKSGYSFTYGSAEVEFETPTTLSTYNIIDVSGKRIGPSKMDISECLFRPKWQWINRNFSYFCHKNGENKYLICRTKNLGNYIVRKIFGGYFCADLSNKFTIKYEPLVIYDKRYILCIDKETIYLHDRVLNEYKCLGEIRDVEFASNVIADHMKNELTLIYEEKKIDITNYYKTHRIKIDDNFYTKSGVHIKSKEEFYIEYERKIKEEHEREKRRKEREERRKRLEKDEYDLEELLADEAKKEKVYGIIEDEAFRLIDIAADKIDYLERKRGIPVLRKVESLWIFDPVDNHKEVNPIYFRRGFFNHIDLSEEVFDDANISGLDLRNHNVMPFDPQKVYKKDLSYCNLEGIEFPITTKFNGVNICGSRFTTNHKSSVFDINAKSLLTGIYDENTLLDGIPLIKLKEELEKEEAKKL